MSEEEEQFGEGLYIDHDEEARKEAQEIEDFWHLEQLKYELGWNTDYEERKSKARWADSWQDWEDCV